VFAGAAVPATTAPAGAVTTASTCSSRRVDSDHVIHLVCNHLPDPPASLVGSDDAGVMQGNRDGRTVMSHAEKGGRAPDQASSGRQTGVAVPPGRIIPKARNAAGHPTNHRQHDDNQAGDA
jgi:hypothetical protein